MENDGVFGGEHSGKGVLLPSMHGVAYYYYVLQSCCGPHHDAAASFAGRVVVAGGSALAAPRIGKVNTLFSET